MDIAHRAADLARDARTRQTAAIGEKWPQDTSAEVTENVRGREARRQPTEAPRQTHELLLALCQAARNVQRARSSQDVYRAIGDEFYALGFHAVVAGQSEDGEQDVPAMSAFAHQAAAALANAELLEAVRRQRAELRHLSSQLIHAQEVERARIARELHDEIGQALVAIRIHLRAIEKDLSPSAAPQTWERLADSLDLIDNTMHQVRELSLDLRPRMLDDLGLVPALQWYIRRYSQRTGIAVQLETSGLEGRLSHDLETALYRVIQEALTNVARHAQAGRADLRLERRAAAVAAVIEDDGRGFAPPEAGDPWPAHGAGLLGIHERAQLLGGRFDIRSRPGQGTRLTVEIPLQGEEGP